MNASQALHLMLSQTSLELRGWHFAALPPTRYSVVWSVVVWHDSGRADRKTFERPQRHDALAQALQFAEMDSVRFRTAETMPAPAREADHATAD
jgi:hypothetical protein